MEVGIISSSSMKIDPYYINLARDISKYLASQELDLVFGGSSYSMMGACYDEFIRQNRKVYAFTTDRWKDDLVNLDKAYRKIISETTFDLKKAIFENSDFIVALPGGTGTISEVLSFIEENRSNNRNLPIEIYDEDGSFKPIFDVLNIQIANGFTSPDIYNYFNISRNKEEFIEHIEKYLYSDERMIKR